MQIQIHKSLNDLSQAFTDLLQNLMLKQGYITIALSGGSTPKSLFNYWSSLPEGEIDWTKIKFFWGDERCVEPTDSESNYKMTKEFLFDHISLPEENIFRIKGENNPKEESDRYGDILSRELDHNKGIPSFDLILLGMGDDGHTASIFPHQMNLWHSPLNCVEATHPDSGQKRVSITGKIINSAKNVAFLVTGENKADKVKEIIEQPELAEKKYPAALVQPESEKLIWFLDDKAAEKLTGKSRFTN